MRSGFNTAFWLSFFLLFSCRTGHRESSAEFVQHTDKVQIVMFHLAQRCESCNAVERETRSLIEKEFAADLESGKLCFVPLDFQSESGKKAADLLRATGQTLFIVRGDSISDLTSAAFMFAQTHPERYRNALKAELDKYLE